MSHPRRGAPWRRPSFLCSDGLPYEKRVDAKGREGEPVCIDDEVPFEVPESWGWMRLADALVNRDSERIPVSVADREKLAKVYDYYGASGVIDKVDSYLFEDPLLLIGEDGANLLARTKPIAFIARGKYWVNNHAHVLDGISEPYLEYIALFINSINLTPYVTGTAQPKMNQTRMGMILIPIPPENEQVRILAKVSELMPLVEEYGALEDERERLDAQLPEALRKSILRASRFCGRPSRVGSFRRTQPMSRRPSCSPASATSAVGSSPPASSSSPRAASRSSSPVPMAAAMRSASTRRARRASPSA